ncbi:MAG: hypothetical protein L5655_01545 [Thermosediminibacteraceae bacterium]|nr:hypothetical protein [Thermosediminibacteraceae bacterium]
MILGAMVRILALFSHFMIISLVILLSIIVLRQRISLLALSTLLFIILDSLGLLFLSCFDIRIFLPYLENYHLEQPLLENEFLLVRQLSAHWIFLILVSLALIIELIIFQGQRKNHFATNSFSRTRILFCIIVLLFLGLLAYLRYFFFGPGFQALSVSRIMFKNTVEAVSTRSAVSRLIQPGQGAYLASLASYIIFPLISFLLVLCWGNNLAKLITIFMFGLSQMYAIQTVQKAPIVFHIVTYSMFLIFAYNSNEEVKIINYIRKNIIKLVVLSLGVGSLSYTVMFGQNPVNAFLSTLGRLILVPGNTESLWFFVFPDVLDYLGITFSINTNMKIIHNVAYYSTGNISSANASFIAVGWSGYGYLGVILASSFFILYLLTVDYFMFSLSKKAQLLLAASIFAPLFFLVSGSIMDFLSKGGIISFLGVIILKFSKNSVNHLRWVKNEH